MVQHLVEGGHRVLKGDDLHLDAGVLPGGPAPLLQQEVHRVHQRHADVNHILPGGVQLPGAAQHRVGLADEFFCLGVDKLPGLGEAQPLGAAVKQLHLQPLLQQIDLLGDGVGGDEQLFRGFEEAAAVRGLNKRVQMPVVHEKGPLFHPFRWTHYNVFLPLPQDFFRSNIVHKGISKIQGMAREYRV